MATYLNPQGSVNGTDGPDTFMFDTPPASWVTIDAQNGGGDNLFVYPTAGQRSFIAGDIFNSGTFYGSVEAGPYAPRITFFGIETLLFAGSALDDSFEIKIGPASSGLSFNIDGGGGADFLLFDFRTLTASMTFIVDDDGSITSSFGQFARVERFTLHAGSGDDILRTGGQNDLVYAYGGSDQILTGAGNDHVYAESGGDHVDMGDGYDFFQGNYSASTEALTVSVGTAISVSNGVTALNAESVSIGTGSGDDRFDVTHVGAGAALFGGAGFDTLAYAVPGDSAKQFTITGYSGTLLDGTAGNMSFYAMERVELHGGAEDDSFRVTGAFLPTALRLDGGGGADLLYANFGDLAGATAFVVQPDGTIVTSRGEFASFERFQLYGGTGADLFTTQSGNDSLGGGGGDDRLDGGAGIDVLDGGPGNDILFGGSDDDSLYGSDGADQLDGGDGRDLLDGGAGDDSMSGGQGDDIYFVDSVGDSIAEAAGEGIDEVRTGLAAYSLAGTEVENLKALSSVAHDFRGSAGNNLVTGGTGNDFLRLMDGGNDTALGGAGNDVFLFGGALTSADVVDGGAGIDQIALQGDYAGAKALQLGSNLVSVENFAILPGNDTRFGDPGTNFYDYQITTQDAAVAAGVQLVVDANRLRAGEDFTFDGSAETDGSFFIYGGGGVDTLTGGAKNDVFIFGGQNQWGSSDVVTGGAGIDQLALRGNYTIVFGAGQLNGIEQIGMVSAQDTRYGALGSSYSYDLTMNDANVAGIQFTVDAAPLRPGETLTFDGSAEDDGSFRVFGGRGNDSLTGSRNGDILVGNGGSDQLTGGAGGDSFRYVLATDSATGGVDRILDFLPTVDSIDLSRIDADTNVDGNQAFHWIGSNAFGSSGTPAGELRAWRHESGSWFVEGDTDGDGAADLIVELLSPFPLGQSDFVL